VLVIEAELADFRSSSSEVVFHGNRLHNLQKKKKNLVSSFQLFQTFPVSLSSMEVIFLIFII
jgi:hypothetical protein